MGEYKQQINKKWREKNIWYEFIWNRKQNHLDCKQEDFVNENWFSLSWRQYVPSLINDDYDGEKRNIMYVGLYGSYFIFLIESTHDHPNYA